MKFHFKILHQLYFEKFEVFRKVATIVNTQYTHHLDLSNVTILLLCLSFVHKYTFFFAEPFEIS